MAKCLRCGKETGKKKEKNPKTRKERLYRFCDKCLDEIDDELDVKKE